MRVSIRIYTIAVDTSTRFILSLNRPISRKTPQSLFACSCFIFFLTLLYLLCICQPKYLWNIFSHCIHIKHIDCNSPWSYDEIFNSPVVPGRSGPSVSEQLLLPLFLHHTLYEHDHRGPWLCLPHYESDLCIAIPHELLNWYSWNFTNLIPMIPSCAYHILNLIRNSTWPPAVILDFNFWILLPLFLRDYWMDLHKALWTWYPRYLVVRTTFWIWSGIQHGRHIWYTITALWLVDVFPHKQRA